MKLQEGGEGSCGAQTGEIMRKEEPPGPSFGRHSPAAGVEACSARSLSPRAHLCPLALQTQQSKFRSDLCLVPGQVSRLLSGSPTPPCPPLRAEAQRLSMTPSHSCRRASGAYRPNKGLLDKRGNLEVKVNPEFEVMLMICPYRNANEEIKSCNSVGSLSSPTGSLREEANLQKQCCCRSWPQR